MQGPPGTGKSFLGGKILQLMLSMEIQKRYKGPILVSNFRFKLAQIKNRIKLYFTLFKQIIGYNNNITSDRFMT